MNRMLLASFICLLISLTTFGQIKRFDNVVDLRLQNSGVIEEDKSVSGYYFFYSIGKAQKGMKTFILNILDENLNEVNTTTFEEGKKTFLVDGNFNGENIMLKFVNIRASITSYLYFNRKGELLNRSDQKMMRGDLKIVNDDGFADYIHPISDTYEIRFMPNKDSEGHSESGWIYESPFVKRNYASTDLLCTTDSLLVNLVYNRKTRSSAKVSFSIQGLKINDGSEQFKVSLNDNYNSQPFLAFHNRDKNTINILGLFYSPDVRALKDNGLGLFNHEISMTGEIVDKKFLFWTNEFREFMKVDDNGMAMSEDQKGFLYFHNIIRHEDGSIVAVAEQYRKKADAAGIALNILAAAAGGSSSASTTKIQIYDMAFFHFNSDFTIRNVEFIPKTKSDFTLPSGYDFTNVHLLANYVKAYGGFDYLFTSQSDEAGTTSVTYLDYEERDAETSRQWVFHAVTLYDDELTKDKLEIGRPSKAKSMRILPGKPGHVLVVEHIKEEDAMNVYLEKINY